MEDNEPGLKNEKQSKARQQNDGIIFLLCLLHINFLYSLFMLNFFSSVNVFLLFMLVFVMFCLMSVFSVLLIFGFAFCVYEIEVIMLKKWGIDKKQRRVYLLHFDILKFQPSRQVVLFIQRNR
ncbi:hypothetical protein AMTRI_Chr01g105490 [Amborella trichopoda]